MIYIFEHSTAQIGDLIRQYSVSHISATPTFYRLRLQRLSDAYDSVVRLTSGGEMFEPSLRESLLEIFPNAKFRNVYAITEAGSLLESDGEIFQIPDDRSNELKISEENELLVHKSLLGQSVQESLEGDWFQTGDMVECVDDVRFRFVGRKTDFVNVGGYRVNPHEVEKYINSVNGVDAAVVTARESSVTGHILVAEIQVPDGHDAATIKKRVKDATAELEQWKQPRLIDVVDKINQSRSGKRVRGGGE
jgi:acyl-coenzyme A synthetase/AMP-(fatty) acid ligase